MFYDIIYLCNLPILIVKGCQIIVINESYYGILGNGLAFSFNVCIQLSP